VLGNGQLLLRRSDVLTAEDKKQAMADIVSETERLQQIIENLLALSRMDAGTELKFEPMLLQKVVQETVSNFQRAAIGRAVTVAVEEPVPIALGEAALVTHVLQNLLGNAVKYSPPGTPIRILVGRNGRDEPQVRVVDEGMGFADEDEAQLFTPFFRSKAAKLKAGGMGLGLAVCRRIVEVQHGTITARSRPEGGAEFTFILPPA